MSSAIVLDFHRFDTKEVQVCQMADDQHFLVDLYANELWECKKIYPKKFDKKRKQWFDFEPVEFICDTKQFGSPNGYFVMELKPIIKALLALEKLPVERELSHKAICELEVKNRELRRKLKEVLK